MTLELLLLLFYFQILLSTDKISPYYNVRMQIVTYSYA